MFDSFMASGANSRPPLAFLLLFLVFSSCQTEIQPVATAPTSDNPPLSALKPPDESSLARSSLQTLQSLAQVHPDNALVHFYLGENYRRQGHFEKALTHFEQNAALDPENDATRVSRALMLIRLGHHAEARAKLEQDLLDFPQEFVFHHLLLRVLVASPMDDVRDGDKAISHFNTLLELGQDLGLVETAAMVYAELGQFEKAISTQQQALRMFREAGIPLPPHFLTNLQRYADHLPCRQPWLDDDPIFTRATYLQEPEVAIKMTPSWQNPGIPMKERLEQIAQTADSSLNVYLNETRAAQLAQTQANATNLNDFLANQPQYCIELLRAGKTEQAIKQFETFQEKLVEGNVRVEGEKKYWLLHNLAVAHLRLAEQDNCLVNHTSESCLFPIQPGGVHQIERGSKGAIKVLETLLQEFPDDLSSRMLLNIAYMTLGQYPDQVPKRWLIPTQQLRAANWPHKFPDKAGSLGIDTDALAGGSIMEDMNNDGLLDLIISSWGLQDPIRFLLNQGDGRFVDATEKAGLKGITGGLNMVTTDYNNDGLIDVFVLRGGWLDQEGEHPNSLLHNHGDGTFSDVTEKAGLLSFHPSQTATWFDYNNDGWLDLYIGNETTGPDPHPCELYRNNGDGTFTECAAEAGVDHLGFVKGVTSGDFDNDGLIDLYLSRMYASNILFKNMGPSGPQGQWHFEDVTASAGVAGPLASFPTWFWDFNNDGHLDLYVSDYNNIDDDAIAAEFMGIPHKSEHAILYRNNGNGTFSDVSKAMKLDRVMVGMGANFGDLDNDGFLDFYIGTGRPELSYLVPNRMFRNQGGTSFEDITVAGGFGHLQKGHGVSFGDLDNDGDQDVYIVMGGAYSGDNYRNALFENPGMGHDWLKLKLVGQQSNRSAIGARVTIAVTNSTGAQSIHRVVGATSSFGVSPMRLEVGLGKGARVDSVKVLWPGSGQQQEFRDITKNNSYQLTEGDNQAVKQTSKTFEIAETDPHHSH